LFNLFLYSAAVTTGVLTISKIATVFLEKLASFIRYKWADRYQRRMEEIRELNIKTHDRLVEMAEAINGGKANQKAVEARMRLLYYASRLKKYDETIFESVNELVDNVSFKENGEVIIKNVPRANVLINEIRVKIDKLWFG
jgi:wyosine [tRNA(Phe)-imidazoG37] synthetase (radical SAM superfamily)